ncbi:MAG: aminoglycoside phosphotransferase family protein [Oscillospiraceae bacterium]|nr:aminoglycoside phosphotransferase family protein [Oscillospiraceae bacterium]
MNIRKAIARIYGKTPAAVISEPLAADRGFSSRISGQIAGVRRYRVQFTDGSTVSFVGKRKSVRIILNGIRMVSGRDLRLALMLAFHHKIFGYNGSSVREAQLYSTPRLLPESHIPQIRGSVYSRITGRCFLAMETLPESEPAVQRCIQLIELLAALHTQYMGKADTIRSINHYTAADYRHSRHILRRMFDAFAEENAVIFGETLISVIHGFTDRIDTEYAAVCHRRTLTHNDCCDRNICIHNGSICIYDWELACCQNPEHDLVELLISLMHDMTDAEVLATVEHYRRRMTELTGIPLTDAQYHTLLRFNTLEYCVNKLGILRCAGKQLRQKDPYRLAVQTARMIRLLNLAMISEHS